MVAITRSQALLAAASSALLHTTALALDTYDVVVVGSGPGGLLAAEYLSRDPSIKVLVLEAGGPSLQASGGTDVPGYAANRGWTKFDIPGEYTAAASIFTGENVKYTVDYTDDRKLQLAQMVGGSSSVNAALYFRVPASYLSNVKWPFDASHVNQVYSDMEADVFGSTDTPSTDGQRYLQEAYNIVAGALKNAGYKEVPKINDLSAVNNKDFTFGHAPFAIKNGMRDSPAKTCWGKMASRANVKLSTYSKVNYVKHNRGTATGVVFNNNVEVAVSSRGTVIMAAGAIGTPKVLIQSGIGPSAQLNGLKGKPAFPGITNSFNSGWVVNEMVGQNLFDTTMALASWSHPQMTAFHSDKKSTQVINDYLNNLKGPLTTSGPVLIAYSSEVVENRHFEYQLTVLSEGLIDQKNNDKAFGTALYINNPESRDSCSFDTNTGKYRGFTSNSLYMSSGKDLNALTKYATHIASTLESAGATFLRNTAQTLRDWVSSNRQYVTNHFGGTCFASTDTSRRCADEKLRVVGTSNIYIADASVMRDGTVNPYGFIMYTGREVGGIIKDAFSKGPPVTQPPTPGDKVCKLLETNVDYIANDLTNVPGAAASDCCKACGKYAGCGAFSWSNYNGGTCYLKSSKGQWKTATGVTSGVVDVQASSKCSSVEANVDYTGADVGNAQSSSYDGCCQLCLDRSNCNAYAWNNYNGGTCYFKSAKGSAINKAGVYSGTVTRSQLKNHKHALEIEIIEEEQDLEEPAAFHAKQPHHANSSSVHVHIRVHNNKH